MPATAPQAPQTRNTVGAVSHHAVLVTEVTTGSPAAHAGVRARDIVIGFADAVVGGIDDLQRLLSRDRIDRATSITVLREGTHVQLAIIPADDSLHRHA